MKAGAAQRDITPPVGMTIDAPTRESIGVNDPLFIRVQWCLMVHPMKMDAKA